MSDLFLAPTITKSASISDCGTFRYRLERYWGPAPLLPFVMLNPSTADANVDDPTIRRCMSFARREGFSGIVVANLCAFRSPSPADLAKAEDPFGPGNAQVLYCLGLDAAAMDVPIVCAWGVHGAQRGASFALAQFRENNARMVCLGLTADGHPRHPLYVKGDQPLIPFRADVSRSGAPDAS